MTQKGGTFVPRFGCATPKESNRRGRSGDEATTGWDGPLARRRGRAALGRESRKSARRGDRRGLGLDTAAGRAPTRGVGARASGAERRARRCARRVDGDWIETARRRRRCTRRRDPRSRRSRRRGPSRCRHAGRRRVPRAAARECDRHARPPHEPALGRRARGGASRCAQDRLGRRRLRRCGRRSVMVRRIRLRSGGRSHRDECVHTAVRDRPRAGSEQRLSVRRAAR